MRKPRREWIWRKERWMWKEKRVRRKRDVRMMAIKKNAETKMSE